MFEKLAGAALKCGLMQGVKTRLTGLQRQLTQRFLFQVNNQYMNRQASSRINAAKDIKTSSKNK